MTHKSIIDEANRAILELERQKQLIQQKINAWAEIRKAHENAAKVDAEDDLVPDKIGFTDSIRVILGKNPDGLTPIELKEQLINYGVSCGSQKNFMTNIHTILRRGKGSEFERLAFNGKIVWRIKRDE